MENWIVQSIVTFIVTGAAVVGGIKYAVKSIEQRVDRHDDVITTLSCDLKKYATLEQCRDNKLSCKADSGGAIRELVKKIEQLSSEIVEQNRRREDAKDENQRLYADINAKLARLEARLEGMMEK